MHFTRGLYEIEAEQLVPTLEKIEVIYDNLRQLPDHDEARFFSRAQHEEAAAKGDREIGSQYVLFDAFNWLKFLWYTNIFKTIKLVDGLVHAYNTGNHLVWNILARSTAEYSAVFYYYKKKLDQLDIDGPEFKASQLQAFEDLMLKYAHGTRFNWNDLIQGNVEKLAQTFADVESQPSAVNVLTALGHLKKRDDRFKDVEISYAMLSDFVHPNMASHGAVIAVPSRDGAMHRCRLALDPGRSRGEFVLICSLAGVHLHLSNILELVIDLSKPISRWLQYIDGKERVTVDFTA